MCWEICNGVGYSRFFSGCVYSIRGILNDVGIILLFLGVYNMYWEV
jgi:hypothetical protein